MGGVPSDNDVTAAIFSSSHSCFTWEVWYSAFLSIASHNSMRVSALDVCAASIASRVIFDDQLNGGAQVAG